MQTGFSLRQIWTTLILFAIIVPVTLIMFWYGQNSYHNQLDAALIIERQANELLQIRIESELKRFKTLLKNKSDPLSFLLDRKDKPATLRDIYGLLGNIVEREQAIHEVIMLTTKGDVIAAVDSGIGLTVDKILSAEEKRFAAQHWGFDPTSEHPEIVIPSLGRTYIGSPEKHEDIFTFSIAVPIGKPAKAVLIALIETEKLWPADAKKEHGIGLEKTRNYILDRRGSLITEIHGSDYQPGDFMTHLAITRSSLANEQWSAETSYTGVLNQPVFGIITTIPVINWTLVSEVIISEITQTIWASLLRIFLLTLLGVILFAGFILYLASKTLKPIQHACEAIDHVTRGDYQYTLKPCGIRELDVMSTGFNAMTKARQEAENLLREREQNLAIILDSIGDAVIATDTEGNVTRMNPVAEQLTGWTFTEAQGQPVKTIFPIIDATTRETIENPVEKVITTGETISLSNHTTLIARDGTEYQIADSAAPIRDNDHISGMVLVFNDVTEQYQLRQAAAKSQEVLQENEQRLAEAQRMARIGNWELDLVSNKLDWSEEIYRIFEIDSRQFDASYEAFLNAIHPDDREKVNRAYTESLKNKAPYSIEHRLRMADGSIKYVREQCETFYDENGKPVRSAGTVQDITEHARTEEQLRRSQKMDALGKLTGGIAHDYNNMLAVIIGYSEILIDTLNEQPKLAKYASEIHHAGKRGAKLTNKLLGFSRKKNTESTVLNLNTLLQEDHHMLAKTLTSRIQLDFELADNLWTVKLDSGDLEDAVINLSINAMHSIDGIGQLTLRTSNEYLNAMDAKLLGLPPGDHILLSITDTGCGMDEITKEKIFEPFYTTKGDKGTGLGLSQVYGFVKRSDGAIKVYSEPGHGTRFALYFPRYEGNDSSGSETKEDTTTDFKGNETILVVDDEPALLDLTREILSQKGYNVICVQGAKQALDKLATKSIDLLISDIIMPEMDGYQLAKVVQEKYPKVKIQLVSGFSDSRHKVLIDEVLYQNLLYKPFNSLTLTRKIRTLLDDQAKKN